MSAETAGITVTDTFPDLVRAELARARTLHRWSGSALEAWAVVREEIDEFWDETKKRSKDRDPASLLAELVQIGAMAQRAAEETAVCLGSFPEILARNLGQRRRSEPRPIPSAHEAYTRLHSWHRRWLANLEFAGGSAALDHLLVLGSVAQEAAEDLGLVLREGGRP